MRILIAGGAGFVGSHLAARLLAEGHRVIVVDNLITGRRENVERLAKGGSPGLEWVDADVCGPLPVAGPLDAVLHLASPASPIDYHRHPLETLAAGADGTRQLLELARREGARFLLASTSEVYGDPDVHPQSEDYWGNVNPVGPRSVYDEAKRFAEAITSAYGRHAGVDVRIARIFNTYGPGMRLDDGRVIPQFVAQALSGQPITVNGDGSQTRSYCYVDDLVDGLWKLLRSGTRGPVNLGNPEEFTVLGTAKLIRELTGSHSPIVHQPMPVDDPRRRRPDTRRAATELGWAPRIRFADGLGPTIADIGRRLREAGASPGPLPAGVPAPAANGSGSPGGAPQRHAHRTASPGIFRTE